MVEPVITVAAALSVQSPFTSKAFLHRDAIVSVFPVNNNYVMSVCQHARSLISGMPGFWHFVNHLISCSVMLC